MDYLQKPVNVKINQDWSEILKKYDNIHSMILSGKLDKDLQPKAAGWPVKRYNFGNMGSVLIDDAALSNNWGTWTGPLLDSQLKWIDQARKLFVNLNFYHSVGLSITYEDVAVHTDAKPYDESDLSQCKLLYVIKSEDPNAKTISHDINDPTITRSFPSVPGTAFLLDTNSPHEVKAKGYRAVLQFKFFTDFNVIADFFDRHGPIEFG